MLFSLLVLFNLLIFSLMLKQAQQLEMLHLFKQQRNYSFEISISVLSQGYRHPFRNAYIQQSIVYVIDNETVNQSFIEMYFLADMMHLTIKLLLTQLHCVHHCLAELGFSFCDNFQPCLVPGQGCQQNIRILPALPSHKLDQSNQYLQPKCMRRSTTVIQIC